MARVARQTSWLGTKGQLGSGDQGKFDQLNPQCLQKSSSFLVLEQILVLLLQRSSLIPVSRLLSHQEPIHKTLTTIPMSKLISMIQHQYQQLLTVFENLLVNQILWFTMVSRSLTGDWIDMVQPRPQSLLIDHSHCHWMICKQSSISILWVHTLLLVKLWKDLRRLKVQKYSFILAIDWMLNHSHHFSHLVPQNQPQLIWSRMQIKSTSRWALGESRWTRNVTDWLK